MIEKPPDYAYLRQAALRYLERFSATEAGLIRVLNRKIDRWARSFAQHDADQFDYSETIRTAREDAEKIAASFVKLGIVNDQIFAESRTRRLRRSGHSRLTINAHLMSKGVASETIKSTVPISDEQEFGAAIRYAKKRGLGPFRRKTDDQTNVLRDMAAMARAGFSKHMAEKTFSMDREEADSFIDALKKN